jgi:peptidoglycan/xylan/chitin deacetylase (PgdA/CDA1 family)
MIGILRDLPVALTIDDARTIANRDGVIGDPACMDTVREMLVDAGVQHCVAFVVGGHARGQEARLERWLAAGFELGNHTDGHVQASRVPAREFLESVKRCRQVLESVAAGARGSAWFRFPYLDRGADAAHREELGRGITDLGYQLAPASVDFFDYVYEEPFAKDAANAEAVGDRYVRVAVNSTVHRAEQARRVEGRAVPMVPFFHFGPVSRRFGPHIMRTLASAGVRWCPLGEALDDPFFRDYVADATRNGVATVAREALGIKACLVRKLARLTNRSGLFGARRLGPPWPHRA